MVDPAKSKMMSELPTAGTAPERHIARLLYGEGYRYRFGHRYKIDGRYLPGKPDLVLSKYRSVIFVHGCFWHCHECHLFKWPATRPDFWQDKLLKNRARDHRNLEELQSMGWRTAVIWECALKGKKRLDDQRVQRLLDDWLREASKDPLELSGEGTR